MTVLVSRRLFLGQIVSALAAPAIVHAGNLMPIKGVITRARQMGITRVTITHAGWGYTSMPRLFQLSSSNSPYTRFLAT